ncbi:MAG: NAD(P)/FAD-dependent oxidoreductase, partial [Myxococcota bacterium]
MSGPDAVVIGAGPNGLFAAARLARAGLRVEVLEAAARPGGALWTVESAGAGFLHDVGAAFVAFRDSVAFRGLDLEARGLRWALGTFESAHPAPDGTCPGIARDLDRSAPTFGTDADRWRALCAFHRGIEPQMLAFLGPLPQVVPALRMGPIRGLRLLAAFLRSSGGFARATFATEAARRVIPSMGLHVDVGPDDPFGTAVCWMLALRATTAGFAVPVGGAAAITRALIADLEAHGGTVRTGVRVDRVRVVDGAVVGVRAGGDEIDARRVIADTSAASLYLDLVGPDHLPGFVTRAMRAFPQGWGTFKLDLSLSAPVPWTAEVARASAVVHLGDALDDLARFTAEVRGGALPSRPYLVIGQQSLVDPSRAPAGHHTLYVYT